MTAAIVRTYQGRLVIVIDATHAAVHASAIELAERTLLGQRRIPDPALAEIRDASRYAAVVDRQPTLTGIDLDDPGWIPVKDAAAHEGVSRQAVLKQINARKRQHRMVNGRWLVRLDESRSA